MPPRPEAPPRRLSGGALLLYCAGVPVTMAALTAGILGLLILMDADGTGPLAGTEFEQLWRRAVRHNPYVQAFTVNFGAIGLGYCVVRLVEHWRATVQPQGAATRAAGKDGSSSSSKKQR